MVDLEILLQIAGFIIVLATVIYSRASASVTTKRISEESMKKLDDLSEKLDQVETSVNVRLESLAEIITQIRIDLAEHKAESNTKLEGTEKRVNVLEKRTRRE